MADPDAPAHKRLRLDSVNPVPNGHTFPPPPLPPHSRPHSHPVPVQAPSPVSRQYPTHSLPPPSQPYPSPGQPSYPGHQPSPSLPPSDIRAFADPRNIPSPGQRPHGVPGPSPVTSGVPQDSISTYRPPPTPQSATAPEPVDVKPQLNMEHGSHPTPWSVNQDHRSNGSVSSGYNPTISPPHPNDVAYHAPPPPGQPYGQPAPYGAPSPYLGQYSAQQAQVRRKQVRATQACNHCRARKQKCDEARPCQFCRENNFDCQYKDVPPPKQDRSMMQLQDSVNSMTDVLTNFIGEFGAWRQDVESRLPPRRAFENTSNMASPDNTVPAPPRDQSTSRMPTPAQGRNQSLRVNGMKMKSPMVPYMSPGHAQASTPIKQEALLLGSQQPATPADSVRTDMSRTTDAGLQDKAGLQSDHTTPAHKLLEDWSAMQDWYKLSDYLVKLKDSGRNVSDYPMQLEQERGLLRPWGYGEGRDLNDGAQGPGSPESSNESDASSPATGKEGLWGHPPPDKASPRTMNGNSYGEEHPGGLGPDGRPDFRVATMDKLLESYERNMHNLHPFFNRSKLQKMFREFKEQYSPDFKGPNIASPATHQVSLGMKRKRSSSAIHEQYPKAAIERSLRNAIVLLVLALGKVCSYKTKDKPLPSPESDKTHTKNAWGDGSFHSDTDDPRPRNIDLMPGMAYYSYATDILGNHHGGLTIAHAQAFILAALYISQFARVLESWSWINSACRITIVLLKADLNKLRREWYLSGEANKVLTPKERYKLDLVLFVYWTCLQLESDIVAEMSTLPTSSVTTYQSFIMYPAGVCESFPIDGMSMVVPEPQARPNEDIELMIYSSQIYLRVIMNEAHNQLYGSKSRSFDENDPKAVAVHVNYHMEVLRSWKSMLLGQLQWNDTDPPSTDRNHARLRAKYYGGLYMMLRPYLRLAVLTEWPPSHQRQPHTWTHQSSPAVNGGMDRAAPIVDLTPDQKEMIKLACICIEAAIRSTIAFDRIGAPEGSRYEDYKSTRTERLVLTNIFGTMHAQFGNMLVLAAVYRSSIYQHLPANTPLTPRALDALFARTIEALSETAPNSPILKVDLDVLINLREKLELPKF
ncbi:hypothetical protein HBI55_024620 [Parastagonospora nodorum]|nr:hypothetical protein HBI55_024620 [Parastagonospora nodorum]